MTTRHWHPRLTRALAVGSLVAFAVSACATGGPAPAADAAVAAGADLEIRNELGQTPLVAATKANSIEIALRLLDAGADPNAKDSIEDSAFLYAGAEGFNEILLATLTHGADVTSLNRFAGTALIPASEHAHVETVRILIDAGVPLDHMNNFGWTALHEAIVLGDGGDGAAQVVRMLLEAGADPRLPSGGGDSPRNLAAGEGYWNLVAVMDQFLAG